MKLLLISRTEWEKRKNNRPRRREAGEQENAVTIHTQTPKKQEHEERNNQIKPNAAGEEQILNKLYDVTLEVSVQRTQLRDKKTDMEMKL